jgi:hypothetical protein
VDINEDKLRHLQSSQIPAHIFSHFWAVYHRSLSRIVAKRAKRKKKDRKCEERVSLYDLTPDTSVFGSSDRKRIYSENKIAAYYRGKRL